MRNTSPDSPHSRRELRGTTAATRRPRRVRGLSLAEVVVSVALMSIFLVTIQRLFSLATFVSSAGTRTAQGYRSMALAFDETARELRLCEKIYYPDSTTMRQGYAPSTDLTRPFVFRRFDSARNGEVPVAFTIDAHTHALVRVIYDPNFDPARPSTWTVSNPKRQLHVLSDCIDSFSIQLVVNRGSCLVVARLSTSPSRSVFQLESTVPVKGI